MLLSIVFNSLSKVVISLTSTSHLVHWIHLMYLMLRWPSSSTLTMALTLVDSIMPKSYLCKPTVIIHGPLGCLLLSVTFPYRERKSIVRLINFLLTSEFV
jgi:hypothetical protein